MTLPRITDEFACRPDCPVCQGGGIVCEEHPDRPWDTGDEQGCECGAAGMPCPLRPCVGCGADPVSLRRRRGDAARCRACGHPRQ